ncbi:rCG63271 [Rattus norvegicus]|uniref:RCG63271 n=1 Tax=Rattus norvegicus TaxID=10116 RepID=A6K728_RAT|nr:rCG63271 [Rattus norvegicus]
MGSMRNSRSSGRVLGTAGSKAARRSGSHG